MEPIIDKLLKAQARKEKRLRKNCPHLLRFDVMFDIGPGWMNIVEDFCKKAEKRVAAQTHPEEFYITQITSSFGTLLIRMSQKTPKMHELLEKAEDLSEVTCDTCGEPGEIQNKYGILQVICNDCRV